MQHVSPELSWQITVEEKSKSPDCICETWPRSIRHGVLFSLEDHRRQAVTSWEEEEEERKKKVD